MSMRTYATKPHTTQVAASARPVSQPTPTTPRTEHVALPIVNALELCAGVGMLGEGVRAGLEFLGIHHRTVCYVEREAAAAAQLATLMEAGALDQAPVWSDMLTFDGAAWRGCVDLVVAGFPCQDLSVAGRRAGLGGKRSGLFFRVLDIADDCGADELVLENVAGIASATASVVDEAEGALEERAVARVLGELADRGWDAEWLPLSASDVGASHGRAGPEHPCQGHGSERRNYRVERQVRKAADELAAMAHEQRQACAEDQVGGEADGVGGE